MKEVRLDNVELNIILDAVCEYFNIEQKLDVFKNSRKTDILRPRQWFQYLSVELNPRWTVSYRHIGEFYSDITKFKYNHATIINSRKSIQNSIDTSRSDAQIKEDLIFIIKRRITSMRERMGLVNSKETTFEKIMLKYNLKLDYSFENKELIKGFIKDLNRIKAKQDNRLRIVKRHKLY